ncbi:P-type DNA transfer protein VirB5 [Betaproteobacteria bacterium]|nr:P-type DNA transfer protein VirB5 [Betaproteobacteria bacterium]
MNMKKTVTTFAAAVMLAVSVPVSAGGIPVIDGAAIANSTMQHMKEIAQFIEQVNQLKAQLEQMEKQYESMTGGRNGSRIAYNPAYREYLPEEWQGVYDGVRKSGALSGEAAAIRSGAIAFDACKNVINAKRKDACQASAVKSAQDKAYAIIGFNKAKERVNQIEELLGAISETEDQKEILELQARIQIEQSLLANEDTKMRLLQQVAAAEDKMIQQQAKELAVKFVTDEDNSNVEPPAKTSW